MQSSSNLLLAHSAALNKSQTKIIRVGFWLDHKINIQICDNISKRAILFPIYKWEKFVKKLEFILSWYSSNEDTNEAKKKKYSPIKFDDIEITFSYSHNTPSVIIDEGFGKIGLHEVSMKEIGYKLPWVQYCIRSLENIPAETYYNDLLHHIFKRIMLEDYIKLPAIDVLKEIYLSTNYLHILSIEETLRTTENSSFRLFFYKTLLYNFDQLYEDIKKGFSRCTTG